MIQYWYNKFGRYLMNTHYVQTSYFEASDGSLFLTAEDCLRYEDILKDMQVLKVGANDRIIEFGVMGCGDKYTNSEIMHILFGLQVMHS